MALDKKQLQVEVFKYLVPICIEQRKVRKGQTEGSIFDMEEQYLKPIKIMDLIDWDQEERPQKILDV